MVATLYDDPMPGTLNLDRLLSVPGTETYSGPRTTIYRRWSEDDHVAADLLHEPYSNPLPRAPRLIITGLHLTNADRECLGVLGSPDPNSSPWHPSPPRTPEVSQIYLWSRIVAIRCRHLRFGDSRRLSTHRFAEELAAMCRSKSSRHRDDFATLPRQWLQHLSLDPDQVKAAITLVPDLLRLNASAQFLRRSEEAWERLAPALRG